MKREDWLFVAGLAAIVLTLVITAYINGNSVVWATAALAALGTLLYIGSASAFSRSSDRLSAELQARLPATAIFDQYPLLSVELLLIAQRAQKFIYTTGSETRDDAYLRIIERKVNLGVDYIRVLYPDEIHASLSAHILRLAGQEHARVLKTAQPNLPHLLITERDMMVVFPQPNKAPPLAFHVSRTDKVEQLRAYFTRLAADARPWVDTV